MKTGHDHGRPLPCIVAGQEWFGTPADLGERGRIPARGNQDGTTIGLIEQLPGLASQPGSMLGMSTQIVVRLPDELVAYVDQAVAAGRARSRADLVSRLLARDARRQRAEDDLQRLIEGGSLRDAEALAMALATSGTPVDDD